MGEFEKSLAKVLVHEGGYVNHPDDPGGATNQGVTQRVYDDYRRSIDAKPQTVRLLSNGERDSIYRMRYWALIKGDSLPPGISYVVFDGAANSGPSQSVKWLQRALGVKADGLIGTETLNAVRAHPNHDALVAKIIALREKFLRALRTFKTFGKGWMSRIRGVLAVGQAWAMGDVGPEIVYVPGGEAKARIEDAKSAPPKAPGDLAAGGGTVGTVITQATDQLTPLSNIEFIAKAVAILTIVGVLVTAAGISYRWWAKRRGDELADALGTV
ncbi:Secretion activator protein [Neorhizobium galegae bv. orientalis]|nr:Secretion activator protein [Neorhizobium galegae bv. orientalis]